MDWLPILFFFCLSFNPFLLDSFDLWATLRLISFVIFTIHGMLHIYWLILFHPLQRLVVDFLSHFDHLNQLCILIRLLLFAFAFQRDSAFSHSRTSISKLLVYLALPFTKQRAVSREVPQYVPICIVESRTTLDNACDVVIYSFSNPTC